MKTVPGAVLHLPTFTRGTRNCARPCSARAGGGGLPFSRLGWLMTDASDTYKSPPMRPVCTQERPCGSALASRDPKNPSKRKGDLRLDLAAAVLEQSVDEGFRLGLLASASSNRFALPAACIR
jgi:hypothetical protein